MVDVEKFWLRAPLPSFHPVAGGRFYFGPEIGLAGWRAQMDHEKQEMLLFVKHPNDGSQEKYRIPIGEVRLWKASATKGKE
jgi:hypothetical protein